MKLGLGLLLTAFICHGAEAHSASDAYLTVTVESSGKTPVLHGQWDIALRDLDFVLDLGEGGRGQLTWGDVRRHQQQIEDYAYRHLQFATAGAIACALKPVKQMIDRHADGAYAVLYFDVACNAAAMPIAMDYRLFFDIDPSHRAIFVGHSAGEVATAVLGPENSKIRVN